MDLRHHSEVSLAHVEQSLDMNFNLNEIVFLPAVSSEDITKYMCATSKTCSASWGVRYRRKSSTRLL
jgi:hypothetical protein